MTLSQFSITGSLLGIADMWLLH